MQAPCPVYRYGRNATQGHATGIFERTLLYFVTYRCSTPSSQDHEAVWEFEVNPPLDVFLYAPINSTSCIVECTRCRNAAASQRDTLRQSCPGLPAVLMSGIVGNMSRKSDMAASASMRT